MQTETKAKHTPGPWTVSGAIKLVGDPNADGAWNLYCADVLPTSEDFLGTICGIQSADHVKGISREEAEANARLIAAAPDLLEALQVAELACAELCQGQDEANECWNTLRTVRAASAKAEGR